MSTNTQQATRIGRNIATTIHESWMNEHQWNSSFRLKQTQPETSLTFTGKAEQVGPALTHRNTNKRSKLYIRIHRNMNGIERNTLKLESWNLNTHRLEYHKQKLLGQLLNYFVFSFIDFWFEVEDQDSLTTRCSTMWYWCTTYGGPGAGSLEHV